MFVKKDVRKIPQILEDAASRAVAPPSPNPAHADDKNDGGGIVTEMRFARRAPEFLPSCSVSLLLGPKSRPALDNLVQLSLYDCGLRTLAGIEEAGDRVARAPLFPQLTSLDLGRNPQLTNDSLPDTLHTQLPELLELWSDDCGFGPHIPATLLELDKLQVVRLTGNQLVGELEDGIGIRYWKFARVLALDGNKLTSVGRGLGRMKRLEKLQLRGNNLTSLPRGVPSGDNSNLVMLSLASNQLSSIPASLAQVSATLQEVYLNGNNIERLPEGSGWSELVALKKLNLSHNSIGKGESVAAGSQNSAGTSDGDVAMDEADDPDEPLPRDFVARFGRPEPLTGECTKDAGVVVRMEGNPVAESIRKKYAEDEKRKTEATAMETEVVR